MGHSGTQKLEKKKIAMTSSANVDRTFRMRSLGTATPGITDQYSDGKAAKVWQLYIGGYRGTGQQVGHTTILLKVTSEEKVIVSNIVDILRIIL